VIEEVNKAAEESRDTARKAKPVLFVYSREGKICRVCAAASHFSKEVRLVQGL